MRYIIALLLFTGLVLAKTSEVRIGILAKRGTQTTLKKWNPTALYLSKQLPEYDFKIVPINFDDIYTLVANGEVDFILTNPGFYVVLENKYDAQRITTLINKHVMGLAQKEFGGVLFTHIDNQNRLNSIQDIKGSSFAAVNENSLGGWQMAWRELVNNDMDKDKDLSSLTFKGTHDNVVYSVLNKEVDVGTVRTDTLERMFLEGKIDLNNIHVINLQSYDHFPFLISTRLYPEWPLAKLKHTPDKLSKQVAIALMQMSATCDAAVNAHIEGWNTPLSYQPVHDIFKVLKIPPYYQSIKFWDVLDKYKYWILFYAFIALFAVSMLIHQLRLTSFLKRTQNELVQTEKMAALGRLVAGVAHEVNTPIGIGVTAASHLINETKKFNVSYQEQTLSKTSFENYIETSLESSKILLDNLERAADIIQNFKKISVDQSNSEFREFYLKEYLQSIFQTLKPALNKNSDFLEIICPETLRVNSVPGAFYQIFTNLIMNSNIHGFEGKDDEHIIITVQKKGDSLQIIYKDNGKGMPKADLVKIFDPFFTTKLGQGGSGLGTHIVYNLVTQTLHGTITAESIHGEGLSFIMDFKDIEFIS